MPGSAKGSGGSGGAAPAGAGVGRAAGLTRAGSAAGGLNKSSMGAALKAAAPQKPGLPGMARVPTSGLSRAASTDDLGTAADVSSPSHSHTYQNLVLQCNHVADCGTCNSCSAPLCSSQLHNPRRERNVTLSAPCSLSIFKSAASQLGALLAGN